VIVALLKREEKLPHISNLLIKDIEQGDEP
jgi:hypothetical protein